MKLFDLANPKDKELLKKEIDVLRHARLGDEHRTLLNWQLKYCTELLKMGCEDKVFVYGTSEKFNERIEKPSPVQLSEIYDIDKEVKKIKADDFEIVGGLGGFTFNNGKNAGELIYLPGGSPMRIHIDGGRHTAMMVEAINVYPLCVLTARKQINGTKDRVFVVVFDNADSVVEGMEKVAGLVGDKKKTITGVMSGSFSEMRGYIFMRSSPQTVLNHFEMKDKKALFLYQTLLGEDINGFERKVHTHGFEAAKFGEPHAFGAHIDTAAVDTVAVGVFVVAGEVVQKK